MTAEQTWNMLGLIAILLLIVSFFIGKNSIWGGLTMGIILCVIFGIIALIVNGSINWGILKDILITVILLGRVFEIVGRLAKK
jgi:hypothetical protein